MIIDSHQHLMLPTDSQLLKMKKAGVDRTILFCTAPHPERANNFEELKIEMGALYKILAGSNTKESNICRMKDNIKILVDVLNKYPNKFYGFGSVPLELSLQETKEWVEKYIISNGLKGVGEFTPGSDSQIQQLEPIFQVLTDFPQLPIWIHTFNPVTLNGIKILMELTLKYQKVSVIYGHMGGILLDGRIRLCQNSTKCLYRFISSFFHSCCSHGNIRIARKMFIWFGRSVWRTTIEQTTYRNSKSIKRSK